ncbi:hypothetical protein LCGC14_0466100 [marine sediment metagenome]|uniref:Uncharacterized protein n=1 Tax=marine sediment metagenome TaxID=412755 RepID=A0A0F9V0K1_9ZZZZ
MTLKFSPFFKAKKRSKKKRKIGLLTGAATALIGLALFTETAAALRRI